MFPNIQRRSQAGKVGTRIRHSIEKYLSVQTIISLMQTVVSYIGMTALGLDNALFWALVIFILNYIPIVGGLAAVALPVMFALVQFDSLGRVGALAGILFGAQFVIGNTIQPKMMGDGENAKKFKTFTVSVLFKTLRSVSRMCDANVDRIF